MELFLAPVRTVANELAGALACTGGDGRETSKLNQGDLNLSHKFTDLAYRDMGLILYETDLKSLMAFEKVRSQGHNHLFGAPLEPTFYFADFRLHSIKCDVASPLPLAFHLTGGEASDSRNFKILLDHRPDITPRAAITDNGYDAKTNREAARRRSIGPVIPYKSNAIDRPVHFPKKLYTARARIEQAVGKLKRFKRIALRCEKTAKNFGSLVAIAVGFILIKSVHTA